MRFARSTACSRSPGTRSTSSGSCSRAITPGSNHCTTRLRRAARSRSHRSSTRCSRCPASIQTIRARRGATVPPSPPHSRTVQRGASHAPARAGPLATRLHDGRFEQRAWWRLPRAPVPDLRGPEALDALEAVLQKAVERQLIADVPVGVFLSGGVDSPLVAALARGKRSEASTRSRSRTPAGDKTSRPMPATSRATSALGIESTRCRARKRLRRCPT